MPATPLVTNAVATPTVATEVVLVLHVPPVTASLSVVVDPPWHIVVGLPDIAPGTPRTVTMVVAGVPHPFE